MQQPSRIRDFKRRIAYQIRPDWVSRDVGLLMLARIAMSSGRAMTGVLLPIYLTLLGFSATKLGVLFGATGVVSAVMSVSIGYLSDRFGRKPFLVLVPCTTALAALVFSMSRAEGLIFAFAAFGSFGRGSGAGGGTIGPYAPAEQAYIATATPSDARNSVFSRIAFCSAIGAVIGNSLSSIPELAHFFGVHGASAYRPAFLTLMVLAFLAGLLAIPIANPRREHPKPISANGKEPEGATPTQPVESKKERRLLGLSAEARSILFRLWGTNSLNGISMGFIGPFITLFFYRRYGVGPGTIGLLYTIINIATMASILSAANFAKRFGLVRTIVVGRIFQGALLIPLVLAPTFWMAGAVYLVRMCFQRVAMPLRQSFVMGMVPEEERGSVGGMSNLPSQATAVVSPTIGGYLFQHIAMELPFELGALFQMINASLFWVFFHTLVPPEERVSAEQELAEHALVTTEQAEQEKVQTGGRSGTAVTRGGSGHSGSE